MDGILAFSACPQDLVPVTGALLACVACERLAAPPPTS